MWLLTQCLKWARVFRAKRASSVRQATQGRLKMAAVWWSVYHVTVTATMRTIRRATRSRPFAIARTIHMATHVTYACQNTSGKPQMERQVCTKILINLGQHSIISIARNNL